MAITFAHPSVIFITKYIPKKYYSLSAIAIGSIAPDFEYFLSLDFKSAISHTLSGSVLYDLPLAVFLFIFYHLSIKQFLDITNLFENKNKKLKVNNFQNKWFVIIISLFFGILSHIIWDGFTYQSAYFVRHIPILKTEILGFQLCRHIQYISSLVGILILFFYSRKHILINFSKLNFRSVFLFIIVCLSLIILRATLYDGSGIRYILFAIVSSFFLGLLLSSLIQIFVPRFFEIKK